MANDLCNIYIAVHKNVKVYDNAGYTPIYVGAALNENTIDYSCINDNDGDNISAKNASYCELTALYYIWKNINSKYVGLVHYRRYFLNDFFRIKLRYDYYAPFLSLYNRNHVITISEALNVLNKYDIIIKKSKLYKINLEKQIIRFTSEDCFRDMFYIVSNDNQNEKKQLIKYLKKHSFIECNMFIASKKLINKYCEWIFPILEKMDLAHKEKKGRYYSNRELGYVAEYLFGYWLYKNHCRCKKCDVVTQGDSRDFEIMNSIFNTGTNVYCFNKLGKKLNNSIYNLIKNVVHK